MFTDQPVTPLRLEILIEVVDSLGASGRLRREALLELLQPETLPDYNTEAGEPRSAAKWALKAAVDLGLVVDDEGALRLSDRARERKQRSARDLLLAALDERVLSAVDIEAYFAPFYSYMLALGAAAAEPRDYQDWANLYNTAVHGGVAPRNPLNKDKVRGLGRWYPYAGLGWSEPGGVFHCEPYRRVERALPRIFGDATRLDADSFMERLAKDCPELDGGALFRSANPAATSSSKVLTLGLAQALVSLHEDEVIKLHCPPDSPGWDLSAAGPPNDGATLRSDRLDSIEWSAPRRNARRGASR